MSHELRHIFRSGKAGTQKVTKECTHKKNVIKHKYSQERKRERKRDLPICQKAVIIHKRALQIWNVSCSSLYAREGTREWVMASMHERIHIWTIVFTDMNWLCHYQSWNVCKSLLTLLYIYIYIYIYPYIYIHIYIYIYIYIYINVYKQLINRYRNVLQIVV